MRPADGRLHRKCTRHAAHRALADCDPWPAAVAPTSVYLKQISPPITWGRQGGQRKRQAVTVGCGQAQRSGHYAGGRAGGRAAAPGGIYQRAQAFPTHLAGLHDAIKHCQPSKDLLFGVNHP